MRRLVAVKISGTVALVTGGSSGIGAATAHALATRGATVLLLARTASQLESVAAEIVARGGAAYTYPVDVADADAVRIAMGRIIRERGTPDIVVHCAGAGRWLFVDETSPDQMVQMMAVPYFGAFHVTQALLPSMIARGSGHFVTVGSPATLLMWPGAAGYIAARWALHGFTEALRADVRGTGVGVTLLIPGKVESGYFAHNPGSQDRVPRIINFTRTLSPADVAESIARSVERRSRRVVIPFGLRVLWLGNVLFPRIGGWIGALTGARRTLQRAHAEDA
jgi:NADP-dependent 3-hydroxy acid dehydrogenase YdfG